MGEYQEMERFGMDNDYEDGQGIGSEFYGKRRQKHAQTEDDILHGVFAYGNSDSDSYDRCRSKRRRKDLGENTEYSKPVNFVSTGSVMPSQEIDRNFKEDNQVLDEDDHRPAGLGTGFDSASLKKSHENKGIGMKLLEKMGYKGGGLGKNEQGILSPIKVKARPKNMGLGFNDHNEAIRPALQELEEKSFVRPAQSLEGRSKGKPRSNQALKKKVYITAEELLAHKQECSFEVVQKVFDMRGPRVRVLTSLADLNVEEKAKENDFPMLELQHNIILIVDLAELDIQKLDNHMRDERENVVALQK